MTGNILLKCFTVAFLFNTDVICGSFIKDLKGNAQLNLLDLLQKKDVDLKRIDSNEAEALVRAIVQTNNINNNRDTKSPRQRILPTHYGLVRDKINEGILTVKDLLAEDLLNDENIEGIIPDNYELIRDVAKNNDRKFRKIVEKSLPRDDEYIVLNNERNIKRIIPPDYEVKGLIPPDYEVARDRKIQSLIPPDYELVKDKIYQGLIPPDYEIARLKIKGVIPPDYELVKDKKYKDFIISPDYEIARNEEIEDLLPSNYELKVLTNDDKSNSNDDDSRSSLEDRLRNEVGELKKVFVKRLVPSNYESPPVEYDHKLNTYFKPLVRLIKQRTDDRSGDEGVLFRNGNEPSLVPFGLQGKRGHNKKEMPNKLRPLSPKEEKRALNLVKHIQYLVTKVNSPQLKRLTLNRILDVLNKVENLRQGEGDPLIPPAENEEPQRKPPPLSAYVPFFNYWTYQKTIIDDDCPKDSVKIGNVCSRIPPHR